MAKDRKFLHWLLIILIFLPLATLLALGLDRAASWMYSPEATDQINNILRHLFIN